MHQLFTRTAAGDRCTAESPCPLLISLCAWDHDRMQQAGARRRPIYTVNGKGEVTWRNDAAQRLHEAQQALASRRTTRAAKPQPVDMWMRSAERDAAYFVVNVSKVVNGRMGYEPIRCETAEDARAVVRQRGGTANSVTKLGLTVPMVI